MHMSALVLLPAEAAGEDVEKWVGAVMAPHEEGSDSGWWDWWQIGGRYTGLLDDYNPNLDPENIETCTLCAGSGVRPDMQVRDGCNGCGGKGSRVKWPTSWRPHPGDCAPAATVGEVDTYTVVSAEGATHIEDWITPNFVKNENFAQERAEMLLRYREGIAVVVDYHS
jgi:hypothetical protein